MPSCSPLSVDSSTVHAPHKRDLPALLEATRPFLRGELENVDPALPGFVAVLRSVGASECWHKHGSFFDHLFAVYRILKIWSAPDAVARCGLFHSAYSNSYVNLAIFDPKTSRDEVAALISPAAERLVHLFCVIPRHTLIHDDLIYRYADEELTDHLAQSLVSLQNAKEKGVFEPEEPWRRKLRELLPAEGIIRKHIRTGEDVALSRRVVAALLLMTFADFSDQLFGYQDALLDNKDGRLDAPPGNNYTALWPGSVKPGLWLNSVSRMTSLYMLVAREEVIYLEERKRSVDGGEVKLPERDEDIELVIPPVFDGCTKVMDSKEQIAATDLYWEATNEAGGKEGEAPDLERAERLLKESVERNPFVGEPRLVLAHAYLGQGKFAEAEAAAEEGLRLMLEWGGCWDKRVSWGGWVAWGRVMLMKAKERTWPTSIWGIFNLGLVR